MTVKAVGTNGTIETVEAVPTNESRRAQRNARRLLLYFARRSADNKRRTPTPDADFSRVDGAEGGGTNENETKKPTLTASDATN